MIGTITIALIVLGSSILAFFSKEFSGIFKKIAAIPGFKLLAPLLLASWVIESFDDWGIWLLSHLQMLLHQLVSKTASLLPFRRGADSTVQLVILCLVACLPVWIVEGIKQWKGYREPKVYIYWVGLWLWVIFAILWVVTQ